MLLQAYSYTDLLSCMLLDASVLQSFYVVESKGISDGPYLFVYSFPGYTWGRNIIGPKFWSALSLFSDYQLRQHYAQGVLICTGGLGLLVTCDVLTGKNWQAVSKGKGDAFMVAAATFYGFSTCAIYLHWTTLISKQLMQRRSFSFENVLCTRYGYLLFILFSGCLRLGRS